MNSTKVKSFKELIVWSKAIDVSVEVYNLTSIFPVSEIYGLTNQIRRASNSVSLNIAEGFSKRTLKSYLNHLNIAQGSLNELDSAIYLAVRLNFIDENRTEKLVLLIEEVGKMLHKLINVLSSKTLTPNP